MAIVYMAVNRTNGKRYIGVTRQSFASRRQQHKSDAKRKRDTWFHAAIRKYGFECFDWMEIYQCDDILEALDAEVRLISLHRPEYNISAGGEGRRSPLSEKTRSKLRGNKNALGNKSRTGQKDTPETTAKRAASQRASTKMHRKAVMCIETGEIFKSLAEAGEKTGIHWTLISKTCNGVHQTANGKRFVFYVGERLAS